MSAIIKFIMLIAVISILLDSEVKPFNKVMTLLLYGIYVNTF